MFKSSSTAQTRLVLGKGRQDTLDQHKFINPHFYTDTEMLFSGKAGKTLKGGFSKGTRAKEKEIFDYSVQKKVENNKNKDKKNKKKS
tara:strand:+ start:222 stop:482 length:261 start_codon:yes stop_codon:yes gene_type:complete